jgi:hypothetical protein
MLLLAILSDCYSYCRFTSVVILQKPLSSFNFTFTINNTDNAICPSTTYNYSTVAFVVNTSSRGSSNRFNVTCTPEDILISPESSCLVACRIFTLDEQPLPAQIVCDNVELKLRYNQLGGVID